MQLEDQIVRRVGDAVDLFEDHVPLGLEIALAEQRTAHQIGEDVHRERKVLVEHVGLVAGVVAAGEGVEAAAAHLELERELPGRPPLGALEHHVLEQMGDAHLLGPLVRAGGAHVDPDGRRADARQPFGEDDQPVRRRGAEQPFVEANRVHDGLLLREQRLPGELHAAAVVHLEQLDLDDVALLDHVLGLLGAAVLQLADVEQPLDARAGSRRTRRTPWCS